MNISHYNELDIFGLFTEISESFLQFMSLCVIIFVRASRDFMIKINFYSGKNFNDIPILLKKYFSSENIVQ